VGVCISSGNTVRVRFEFLQIAGAAQLPCLPAILHPSSLAPCYREREDGRRRIVLPILPSSMTLGDDHREGANVLLPPAFPFPVSLCLSPFALRRPLRFFFSSSSSSSSTISFCFVLLLFLLMLLPSSLLLRLFPAGTLRSSYHNRRHPSCITCHFVPRRILSPRHDNRARIHRRIDASDAERVARYRQVLSLGFCTIAFCNKNDY